MGHPQPSFNRWEECRVGITGANGRLGKALSKRFRNEGAFVLGFTHSSITNKGTSNEMMVKMFSSNIYSNNIKKIFFSKSKKKILEVGSSSGNNLRFFIENKIFLNIYPQN